MAPMSCIQKGNQAERKISSYGQGYFRIGSNWQLQKENQLIFITFFHSNLMKCNFHPMASIW